MYPAMSDAIDGMFEPAPPEQRASTMPAPEQTWVRGTRPIEGGTVKLANGIEMTRAQAKEACRLAYLAGQATLAELSTRYEIAYQTLRNWSHLEQWGESKSQVAVQLRSGQEQKLAEWMAEQREEQVKRAVGRAGKLHKHLDRTLEAVGDQPFTPKDLQALAMAEERVDLTIRRNLGMEGEGGGGPGHVSVNVLSGSVEISGLG